MARGCQSPCNAWRSGLGRSLPSRSREPPDFRRPRSASRPASISCRNRKFSNYSSTSASSKHSTSPPKQGEKPKPTLPNPPARRTFRPDNHCQINDPRHKLTKNGSRISYSDLLRISTVQRKTTLDENHHSIRSHSDGMPCGGFCLLELVRDGEALLLHRRDRIRASFT